MKRLVITAFLALTMCTCAFAQIPSVKLENMKSEIINTADLIDGETPVVISFWGTTCKPCIMELDAIYAALPDWQEEADFRIVAVSTDDSRFTAKAKSMAEGHGWDEFTVLFDKNREFARALNVNATPQVFIYDKNGKLIYSHTGYTPGSENEIIEAIKKGEKKGFKLFNRN